MQDLMLNLPEGVRLNILEITSVFPQYSELLQRVVMLIFTSNHSDLTIDGKTLPEFLRNANMQNLSALNSQLIFIANAAKELLNADSYEIDTLSITAVAEDREVKLNITVKALNATVETGEFTI